MAVETARQGRATADTRKVQVRLGGRSYDIVIGAGLLAQAGSLIADLAPGARAAVVTDETVARLHLPAVEAGLAERGLLAGSIAVPAGEASKGFGTLETVCRKLLALGVERGDSVIALGGGMIGDLAGFAAAILRRGVRLVQMPTTLLAQVDSSVGGKTGINTGEGKNLIGAFHQPCLVIADTQTLATLPERELRAGYAEAVKYALLGDAAFFTWLEANRAALFAGDPEARAATVETCCRAKSALVEADEHELGERALLNLGHTFGHALEAYSGYSDRLLHGEAVAIGMALAFAFSHELGLCPESDRDAALAHLAAAGLPVRIADIAGPRPEAQALLALMGQDKKVRAGKLAFILVKGIGQAFVARDVPMERVEAFLARACEDA